MVCALLPRPMVFAGFALLHHAYQVITNPHTLRSLLAGVCTPQDLDRLRRDLRLMFASQQQVLFLIVFSVLASCNSIAFGDIWPAEISLLPVWLARATAVGCTAYTAAMVGPGVWLAIASTLWARSYTSPDCIRVEGLGPHRHVGLRAMAAVLATYALCFSLETSLVLSAFYAFPLGRALLRCSPTSGTSGCASSCRGC